MRLLSGLFVLLSCFLTQAPTAANPGTSGIKITKHSGSGETSNDETIFIQSDRSRRVYRNALKAVHGDGTLDTRPSPLLVVVTRCDLGQVFGLNLEDREYAADSIPRFNPTEQQVEEIEARTDNRLSKVAPWMPTVRQERATVDTGERKNFFGHEARHVITTWKTSPLAESHLEPRESVTDGWYIDLDTHISCEPKWAPPETRRRHEYYTVAGERYEIIDDGIVVTAFAIERKSISRSIVTLPDRTKRETGSVWEEKVTDFYEGPLDPALFVVPSDFRRVRDLRTEPPLTLADRWYLTRGWVKGLVNDLFK